MSFPRAQVKRFNEQQGCAPPPGHYDMPELNQGTGIISFDTGGQRFKEENGSQQPTVEVADQLSTTFLAPNAKASSKKKLNFAAPASNVRPKSGSNKNTPVPSPTNNKEKQAYEQEIRRLLQQVTEQDKKLQAKIQDAQKLEARLNILSKDKSCLLAQVASTEKKLVDLERKNTFLQNQKTSDDEKQQKRDDLEAELKKTKQKLDLAKQELEKCRSLLVALQSDLEAARSTISALQQSNDVLTQLNKEVQQHSDDVADQVDKLQSLNSQLRADKVTTEEDVNLTKNKLQCVEKEFTEILQNKVEEIESKLAEKQKALVEQLKNTEIKLMESTDAAKNLEETVTQLKHEKDKLIQEKFQLASQVAKLNDEHKECSEIIRTAEKKLLKAKENHCKADEEKKQLQDRVNTLEEEVQRITANSEAEAQNATKTVNSLQDEVENGKSQNAYLKEQMQDLESEKNEMMEKIAEVSTQNEQLKKELSQARADCDETATESSALKTALEEIENERKLAEMGLKAESDKLKGVQEEKNIISENLEAAKLEAADFKEQILLLEAKSDALETQLMISNQNVSRASESEESANQKITELEQTLKEKETDYQAKLNEFTRRLLDTQKRLNSRLEEIQIMKDNKEAGENEVKKVKKLLEQQTEELQKAGRTSEENAVLAAQVGKMQNELNEATKKAAENAANWSELEKWKTLYNDLREKVEPFQGQIDAYSAEKAALLNENTAAHAEMQALGKKYAELLGHQNQKQKIRHVVKIKQENIELKQELAKSRTLVAKLQKQVLANRPSKFNPANAFQCKKENERPFANNN